MFELRQTITDSLIVLEGWSEYSSSKLVPKQGWDLHSTGHDLIFDEKKKVGKCFEGLIPTLLTLVIYKEFLTLGNIYTILKAKIDHCFIYPQCRIKLLCFNPSWKLNNKAFQFIDI